MKQVHDLMSVQAETFERRRQRQRCHVKNQGLGQKATRLPRVGQGEERQLCNVE